MAQPRRTRPYFSEADPVALLRHAGGRLQTAFFNILYVVLLGLVVGLSMSWSFTEEWGEYFALMFWATVGMMLLTASEELVTLFLTLETMTICLYLSTALEKTKRRSAEGGLKYFVYGSVSSALFLFGLSLLYGMTGTTPVRWQFARSCADDGHDRSGGQRRRRHGDPALMLVGFGFKVAAVPFHQWAPDAYEGAPAPVTAWIATGSKLASFVALMKVFLHALLPWSSPTTSIMGPGWIGIIAIISAVTMTYGNFAALAQKNFKRMLAYSSIAHAGYILVGVAAVSVSMKGPTAAGVGALLPGRLCVRQCRRIRRRRLAGPRPRQRRHRRPERPRVSGAAPGDLHPGSHAVADRHSAPGRVLRQALRLHGSAQPDARIAAGHADLAGGARLAEFGRLGVLLCARPEGDVPPRAGRSGWPRLTAGSPYRS